MWLTLSIFLSMLSLSLFIIASINEKTEEVLSKQKQKQSHIEALGELIDDAESNLLSIHRTLDAFYLDKDYVEDAVKNLTLFLDNIKEKSEELKKKEY